MPAHSSHRLCQATARYDDNQSHLNLVAWCLNNGCTGHLIVVNLSETPSQGRIRVPVQNLGRNSCMGDEFSGAVYDRNGDELRDTGLYGELKPWEFDVLKF